MKLNRFKENVSYNHMQRKERCDKGIKRVEVSMPRSEATAWRHAEPGKYNDKPIDKKHILIHIIV